VFLTVDRLTEASTVATAGLGEVAEGWIGEALRLLLVALVAAAEGTDMAPPATDDYTPAAPPYTGPALVILGELARRGGDRTIGAERARRALHVLAEAGIALYVPDALDLLARCTREAEPAARLQRAAAAFRRKLGTVPQRWLALQADGSTVAVGDADVEADLPDVTLADALALATRGRGSRRRPSVGWESLTPAELAVVRLVAEGATNAQIAQRLFVARRTVATHLEHVYAKLGVRSRVEVAAIAARRQL
jgi:DNA-binding CsgD family transcriptional regulator